MIAYLKQCPTFVAMWIGDPGTGAKLLRLFDNREAAEAFCKLSGFQELDQDVWSVSFQTQEPWIAVDVLGPGSKEPAPVYMWNIEGVKFHAYVEVYASPLDEWFAFGYAGEMFYNGMTFGLAFDPILSAVAPPGVKVSAIGNWPSSEAAVAAGRSYIRRLMHVYGEDLFKQLLCTYVLGGVRRSLE